MKLLVLIPLLTALVASKTITTDVDIPINSAYGYLNKYGVKLANTIREAELKFTSRQKHEHFAKIVDGTATFPGALPYQAGILADLRTGAHSVCGGSLINERRVLTAAHCWFDGEQQSIGFTVVLGSNFLFSGGTRLRTSSVVVHDQWYPKYIINDIAMVYLPNAVTFSSTIQPIALPSALEEFENNIAIASGFGRTGDGPYDEITGIAHLRHVQLQVISNALCRLFYGLYIQPSNICSKGYFRQATCKGDSGGPLVVVRNLKPILIGVTSFGAPYVCELGFPSVFTRVTSYIDWIKKQL